MYDSGMSKIAMVCIRKDRFLSPKSTAFMKSAFLEANNDSAFLLQIVTESVKASGIDEKAVVRENSEVPLLDIAVR